ncbi:hypothetical protein ElyMa_003550100 [Elysia marginata]|uniref:MARVEL domain-containing protein n=1 Tax=Elysia marginata TaxID=1093978 RepID=A0AAV4EKF7_9GAST|nr:hypothetical protein ElyMa_003550100 [Elysia marginata]
MKVGVTVYCSVDPKLHIAVMTENSSLDIKGNISFGQRALITECRDSCSFCVAFLSLGVCRLVSAKLEEVGPWRAFSRFLFTGVSIEVALAVVTYAGIAADDHLSTCAVCFGFIIYGLIF